MKPDAADGKTHSELTAELDDLRRQLAELMKMSAEHQQTVEVLRASEKKYCLLLDESSDPIFSFSAEGRYHYVNQAFASGVGRKLEDIVGHSIWDVFPQDEADKRFAVVKWVFEHGESKVIEVRVPRADGDRYYITTAKPIFGQPGEVSSVICISKEITERKNMEDRLARMAQYDVLTDLPNRALFSDRLQHAIAQARRDKTRLALMFVDLDQFKPINDGFGHQVGDLLLQAAAKRLQESVRESDTVGRIGGDEFVVLLPLIEAEADALRVAEKIRAAVNRPFAMPGGQTLNISSSIGIALYPDHGNDEIELVKHADAAMYRAKLQAGNRVQFFS